MSRICRSIFVLVSATLSISGCGSEPQTDLDANKNLVRQFLAETDAQNFAAYGELLSDDLIAHFPNGVEQDRKTHDENEKAFAVAFPDVTRSIDQIVADEDRAVVRFTLRGTHNGPFGDIPPTGNQVEVTANIIYRSANGRIIESWVEADLGAFVRSLVAESGQQYAFSMGGFLAGSGP